MSRPNSELSPQDVVRMPLAEFEQRFGFRPIDSLDKKWFAINARRISVMERDAVNAGILGEIELTDVVMD